MIYQADVIVDTRENDPPPFPSSFPWQDHTGEPHLVEVRTSREALPTGHGDYALRGEAWLRCEHKHSLRECEMNLLTKDKVRFFRGWNKLRREAEFSILWLDLSIADLAPTLESGRPPFRVWDAVYRLQCRSHCFVWTTIAPGRPTKGYRSLLGAHLVRMLWNIAQIRKEFPNAYLERARTSPGSPEHTEVSAPADGAL